MNNPYLDKNDSEPPELDEVRMDNLVGFIIYILINYHNGVLVLNDKDFHNMQTGIGLKIQRSADDSSTILRVDMPNATE